MTAEIITKENFNELVLESKTPVLLDFWATWCGPCRMISPILDEVASENPHIKVGKVNVDEQGALAMKFNVMSIPTLVYFVDGKPVETVVGMRSKAEILEIIRQD